MWWAVSSVNCSLTDSRPQNSTSQKKKQQPKRQPSYLGKDCDEAFILVSTKKILRADKFTYAQPVKIWWHCYGFSFQKQLTFLTRCASYAHGQREWRSYSGRSWENINLNLSREQTLGRRCYPVVLSEDKMKSWKSTEEKSFSGEKKWGKQIPYLPTPLSLFSTAACLKRNDKNEWQNNVTKNVRKHFGPSPVSNSKKRSKTWKYDFSAHRISRCENPSKINRQRCNSLCYCCCCFILTSC